MRWIGPIAFFFRVFFLLIWLILSFVAGFLLWGLKLLGRTFGRWDLDLNRIEGRIFGLGGLWLCGFALETEGLEKLQGGPYVFVANHQSALDAVILGAIFPSRTVIIGKREIIFLPLFGLFFWAAGNILIHREHHQHALKGIARAAREVRERSVSILIFPEGTRSRGRALLLPFKKGAFHLAISAQVPLVPIVIEPTQARYDWKRKAIHPGKIHVKVLDPISTAGLHSKEMQSVCDLTRQRMLAALKPRA